MRGRRLNGGLRMKPLVLGVALAVMGQQGGAAPAGFTYPLAGSASGLGYNDFTMTNGDQTGSFVVPAATAVYSAPPVGFYPPPASGQTLDATAGKNSIGVSIDALPLSTMVNAIADMGMSFNAAANLAEVLTFFVRSTDSAYSVWVTTAGSPIETVMLAGVKPDAIYLIFDAAANLIRPYYVLAGVAYAMTAQAYTPLVMVGGLFGRGVDTGADLLGQTVTGTFVTAAANMTAFPAVPGATDFGGTAI